MEEGSDGPIGAPAQLLCQHLNEVFALELCSRSLVSLCQSFHSHSQSQAESKRCVCYNDCCRMSTTPPINNFRPWPKGYQVVIIIIIITIIMIIIITFLSWVNCHRKRAWQERDPGDSCIFNTLVAESCVESRKVSTVTRIGCVWDDSLVTVDGFGAAMWEKCAQSPGHWHQATTPGHDLRGGRGGGGAYHVGGTNREPGSYIHIRICVP